MYCTYNTRSKKVYSLILSFSEVLNVSPFTVSFLKKILESPFSEIWKCGKKRKRKEESIISNP